MSKEDLETILYVLSRVEFTLFDKEDPDGSKTLEYHKRLQSALKATRRLYGAVLHERNNK